VKDFTLYILNLQPALFEEFFSGANLPEDLVVKVYKTYPRFLKALEKTKDKEPRSLLFISTEEFNPEMARKARIARISAPMFLVMDNGSEKDYLTFLSVGVNGIFQPPFNKSDVHYILNGITNEAVPFPKNNEIVREGRVRLDFLLPSKLTCILGLNRLVSVITSEFGFPAEESNVNLPLVVDEALSNAVIHGNKNNESLKVHVQMYVSNRRFHMKVEDSGEGFDWNSVVNPTDEENIFKGSGRGLFLINELMDKVVFKKGGRVIEMERLNTNSEE